MVKSLLKVNDVVQEGQVIGKSGVSGNAKTPYEADEHLHFELRTQAGNMKGLSTKLNPNLIVDTKFESQNPEIKPQSNIGIIKIYPDGKKEIKNPF